MGFRVKALGCRGTAVKPEGRNPKPINPKGLTPNRIKPPRVKVKASGLSTLNPKP